MTFEEVFPTLPDGWLTEGEARLLWDSASMCAGPILEVGCYKGRSTCLLAALGRTVYAVDPFVGFDPDEPTGEVARAAFFDNLMSRETVNVMYFPCKIEEWNLRPAEFCYLDGDHSYQGTRDQIITASKCQAKLVAVHDVNDSGGGVEIKRACLTLLGPWNQRVERLAVWDLRKRG